MAININSVYKAVLVVLEQGKRGVLTPNEFNKIATQAQQEIFTQYFDDLNQLLGMPQTSLAYADRMALLDEKISIFKTNETLTLAASKVTPTAAVQELGSVIYTQNTPDREVQRIQQYEIYTTNQSPLTAPTAFYPVYTYEGGEITLFPALTGSVVLNYLKFPADVKWGFNIDPELGNYIYNSLDSTDFEIHKSDQPLLIDKILGYAGVMTKDQFVMSLANSKEQQINVNDQK
tara:strand:+ start:100 stop:798 length:699 start_codon:yes stop_codon:yes gene_type:complete